MEVNCQKSVCTESRDTKQWRKNEQIHRKKKREINDIISVIGCIILLRVDDICDIHCSSELVNQHPDQKQPDSEAMFLNFLAKTKSFWSRRLLQCSAWWRCRTSTRWTRKVWDASNPLVDFFWPVAALEASKFLSALGSVCVFQDDLTKPTSLIG